MQMLCRIVCLIPDFYSHIVFYTEPCLDGNGNRYCDVCGFSGIKINRNELARKKIQSCSIRKVLLFVNSRKPRSIIPNKRVTAHISTVVCFGRFFRIAREFQKFRATTFEWHVVAAVKKSFSNVNTKPWTRYVWNYLHAYEYRIGDVKSRTGISLTF